MTTTFFKLSRRITHTHWSIEGEAKVGAQGKFTALFGEILTMLSPAITKPVNLKKNAQENTILRWPQIGPHQLHVIGTLHRSGLSHQASQMP